MRLFIGITLPEGHRARIHRALGVLRGEGLPVRWVEPDNFHVTLKFLGEVRGDHLQEVESVLTRVGSQTKSFTTKLSGFGAFPTVRRPRVIWLGVGATSELRCLKQDLEWSLTDVGFESETRAFHPHVTLGRAERSVGAGLFQRLDSVLADLDVDITVDVTTVDLIRSRLSRTGSTYSVVSSAALASA